MEEKVNKKKYIVIAVIIMLAVSILGTLAWYTYGTKKSSLVLILGDTEELLITLSPYQLDIVADPVTTYTSMTDYVTATAVNRKAESTTFKLYYDIEEIDSVLASTSMKYAVRKSTTKNGTYNEVETGSFTGVTSGEHKIIYTEEIPANTSYYYKVYTYLDGNASNSSSLSGKSMKTTIGAEKYDPPSLYGTIADEADITTTINFSSSTGTGIFRLPATASDTYPVYYYRGSVTNNNVYFANFCWKIVRTTSTGGVKLIYNGTNTGTSESPVCNNSGTSSQIGTSKFNSSSNSLSYVGYMYGAIYTYESTSETGWYYAPDVIYDNGVYTLVSKNINGTTYNVETKSNISSTNLTYHHYTCGSSTDTTCTNVRYVYYVNNSAAYYITLSSGKKVEDALSEMLTNSSNTTNSVVKGTVDTWYASNMTSYTDKLEDTPYCNDRSIGTLGGWNPDGGSVSSAFSTSDFRFAYYVDRQNSPIVTCPNNNDAFTVSTLNGNGKLTYPVGLITADEIKMIVPNSYLKTGQTFWAMSPGTFSNGYEAQEYFLNGLGSLSSSYLTNTYGVRPVVSLKPGTSVSGGDGSVSSPYIIN